MKIPFPLCHIEILMNVIVNYNMQVKHINSQTSPSLSPYLQKDLTVDVAEILFYENSIIFTRYLLVHYE